ncbi:MAG: TolC family protein [Myxococcota bacterium]|nr:TolC family protein [Myxococcota bacterium]MDW8361881.1 TolC family protein [Myxococcales bacterium]
MRGALLVVATGWTPKAQADVVPLSTLERAALERAGLEALEAGERAARAVLERAGASRRPRVALSAGLTASPGGELVRFEEVGETWLVQGTRGIQDPESLLPQARWMAGVGLRWDVLDFGRSAAATRAARAAIEAREAATAIERDRVVRGVRAAYLAWVAATASERLAEQRARAARERLMRLEGLVQSGVRPPADLAPARADETRARLELVRSRGEVAFARLAVAEAAGVTLDEASVPDLSVLDASGDAESTGADAGREHERRAEAASAMADAHERASGPLLSVSGELGLRGQMQHVFPAYRAELILSWPFADGGESAARAEEARAQAREAAAMARAASESRQFGRERARVERAQAEERIAVATELVEAAEAVRREAEQRFELGAGRIEQLVEADAQLAAARLELLLARVARARAVLLRP